MDALIDFDNIENEEEDIQFLLWHQSKNPKILPEDLDYFNGLVSSNILITDEIEAIFNKIQSNPEFEGLGRIAFLTNIAQMERRIITDICVRGIKADLANKK
jgi:hypothetical protein